MKIGLVINPLAGIGGPAAMKGSDDQLAQQRARELGVVAKAQDRARHAFSEVARRLGATPLPDRELRVVAPAGAMGADALVEWRVTNAEGSPFTVEVLEELQTPQLTSRATTIDFVRALAPRIDLLVFVGGDGTARDVLDALAPAHQALPVLGIPAGVKMHSGVFATSPGSAAELLLLLLDGALVAAHLAEVKDIDEDGLRQGRVGSVRYGELLVPSAGGYLQHVKSAGKEVEALVLMEIAAEIAESSELGNPGFTGPLVIGPGSTCFAVKEQLLASQGSKPASDEPLPTLLGVDVIADGELLIADATASDLERLSSQYADLGVILSFSRGQGFVLGRGNQQLSPGFLASLDPRALHVVSSRTKLGSLNGRALLVDSGDGEVDTRFSGVRPVISGYQDRLLYLVKSA